MPILSTDYSTPPDVIFNGYDLGPNQNLRGAHLKGVNIAQVMRDFYGGTGIYVPINDLQRALKNAHRPYLATLAAGDLSGSDFTRADLRDTTWSVETARDGTLPVDAQDCTFDHSDLRDADMAERGATFDPFAGTTWRNASMAPMKGMPGLVGKQISSTVAHHETFPGDIVLATDGLGEPVPMRALAGMDGRGGYFHNNNFMRALLAGGNFRGARFKHTTFNDGNASSCDFTGAHLRHCDFTLNNLSNSIFVRAHMENCKFDLADLRGAIFDHTATGLLVGLGDFELTRRGRHVIVI